MPRSGTGAVGTMIDQLPEVRYLGETFVEAKNGHPPQDKFWYYGADFSCQPKPLNTKDIIRLFLEGLKNVAREVVVDFKTFQLIRLLGIDGFEELKKISIEIDASLIYLHRSPLACFYSAYNAQASGVYHTSDRRNIPGDITLEFNLREFGNYLDFSKRFWEHAADTAKHYERSTIIHYESIFAHDKKHRMRALTALETILGANGLEEKKPIFVKQTIAKSYEEVITNYKDVVLLLREKGFAK